MKATGKHFPVTANVKRGTRILPCLYLIGESRQQIMSLDMQKKFFLKKRKFIRQGLCLRLLPAIVIYPCVDPTTCGLLQAVDW